MDLLSTARKTVHLLHLRPFHRHSRNAADGKHATLLLTAQPVACGVQCQKNAEQRGRHYLRRQIPRTLPARNPPYRPCLSYVDSFQIPTTHPQAGTFCTDCQDLPLVPSRHTTEKNVPDHQRTFSGEGRRKSGEPDADGAQRATGGQPRQDAAQRDHSLFLCAPGAEAERLHRQLRQHPAECTHGKPEIMPAARRGTCLPGRGTDGDSIGTHRAYLYNRKYEIHPVDTCEAAHPYRVKDFLSDTNHTLHTAAFPACLYQADDSDHLAGIALQRFAVTNMPIDILVKSCIITGKAWIRFMHDSTALFRMKSIPQEDLSSSPQCGVTGNTPSFKAASCGSASYFT